LDLAFTLGRVHLIYMYDIVQAFDTEKVIANGAIERYWK
jgi:hypothetical protein